MELGAVRGALAALPILGRLPMHAKQLAQELGVSDETAKKIREVLLRLKLVVVTEVAIGGSTAQVMSLTAAGRGASKGASIIAQKIIESIS